MSPQPHAGAPPGGRPLVVSAHVPDIAPLPIRGARPEVRSAHVLDIAGLPIRGARRTHPGAMSPAPPPDRGSVAVELVVLVPVFVVLLLAVAFGGRVVHARTQVRVAADQAARAASLERSPAAAEAAARRAVATNAGRGLGCRSVSVEVDLGGFASGGSVAVTVRCRVSAADLGLLGVPAATTITARSVEVVDRWRA